MLLQFYDNLHVQTMSPSNFLLSAPPRISALPRLSTLKPKFEISAPGAYSRKYGNYTIPINLELIKSLCHYQLGALGEFYFFPYACFQ